MESWISGPFCARSGRILRTSMNDPGPANEISSYWTYPLGFDDLYISQNKSAIITWRSFYPCTKRSGTAPLTLLV